MNVSTRLALLLLLTVVSPTVEFQPRTGERQLARSSWLRVSSAPPTDTEAPSEDELAALSSFVSDASAEQAGPASSDVGEGSISAEELARIQATIAEKRSTDDALEDAALLSMRPEALTTGTDLADLAALGAGESEGLEDLLTNLMEADAEREMASTASDKEQAEGLSKLLTSMAASPAPGAQPSPDVSADTLASLAKGNLDALDKDAFDGLLNQVTSQVASATGLDIPVDDRMRDEFRARIKDRIEADDFGVDVSAMMANATAEVRAVREGKMQEMRQLEEDESAKLDVAQTNLDRLVRRANEQQNTVEREMANVKKLQAKLDSDPVFRIMNYRNQPILKKLLLPLAALFFARAGADAISVAMHAPGFYIENVAAQFAISVVALAIYLV